ncbi:MAG: DUF2079 domain-containing protein [Bacteroidia bacterium]|nr:DUF2079 domain-containing protein [Bacteroidia bacterium]
MSVASFLNKIGANRQLALSLVFLLFGALHLHISLVDHYLYKTNCFDFGVYNFAFRDFAHFRISPCPLYHWEGDVTFLQDHFSLTLPLLSPLYWVMNPIFGTYSLLILQWLFVMFGGYATYKLILFKSHNFNLALSAVLVYFTIYCRFAAHNADCNLVIMGSAMVPVFYYFFEKRKIVPLIILFVFLILNREDVSLGIFFFCLMLFVIHRKNGRQRNLALYLALASAAAFIIMFAVIIPAVENPQRPYSLFNYAALGKTPKDAFFYVLSHPLETIKLLYTNTTGDPYFDGIKSKFYIVFFLSGGFMLLYRPVYLIALIPLVAKKMFNDDPVRWNVESYQGTEIASILPCFVFLTLNEIKPETIRRVLTTFVCIMTLEVTLYYMYRTHETYYGVNRSNVFSEDLYKMSDDVRIIRKIVETFPDDASICTSGHITPHLAFRDNIRIFPGYANARYIFLEKHGSVFPITQELFDSELEKLRKNGQWVTIYDYPGVILLRRR